MTMTDTTYNGWLNRQTWAVSLHLSNDYDLYKHTLRVVSDADSVVEAADELEEWLTAEWEHLLHHDCCSHNVGWVRSMVSDMVTLGPIDWTSVAEGFWEEREEDDEE